MSDWKELTRVVHVHRKLKIVPGSLMKAVIRPGGGELRPADGDQVYFCPLMFSLDWFFWVLMSQEFNVCCTIMDFRSITFYEQNC